MKILLVIPAYNEAENIERVVNNLISNYPQYDYLIINDGSSDNTASICQKQNYSFLNLPVNLGLAGAFQAGLKYAYKHDYDYAIQFDGDGQHRPEYIKNLISELEKGYDIVIGSRFVTEKKPRSLRMLGSNLISLAIRLTTGTKINDPTSGFRIFNKDLIKKLALGTNYGPEPDTISHLIRKGTKISEVQVTMDERIAGESYLNLSRSISYMTRMFVSILFIQHFRKS